MKLLLLHLDLVDWAADHLRGDWITHALAGRILAARWEARANGTWTNLAAFTAELNDPEARTLITEMAVEDRPVPNPAQQVADLVLRLRNQFIDREIAALGQRAGQPELPEPERLDLLRRQQELRLAKRQPLQPLGQPGQG